MSSLSPGISSTSCIPAATTLVSAAEPIAENRGIVASYMQLTKARLSALVLLTTLVGFILASTESVQWVTLCWTLLGTALAAGCANSLNQIIEINRDRRMLRTRYRPLPTGAMSRLHGLSAGLLMGGAGVAILATLVNWLAAILALITIVVYVLLYTPLKVRSTLNTFVGAVSGAIPPMIGWAAASGTIGRGALLLGAILFIWQLPHFLALAWMYREDYERGGFMMLPVLDRSGAITTRVVVFTSALLLPLGLVGSMWNVAGPMYAVGSLLLGIGLVTLSLRFHSERSRSNARAVFLASIMYLPLLMLLMVLDQT